MVSGFLTARLCVQTIALKFSFFDSAATSIASVSFDRASQVVVLAAGTAFPGTKNFCFFVIICWCRSEVRLGKIERLQQSTSRGLGLRVIKNDATANTFTTDFMDKAVQDLARETMEIVKISSADEHNGLAPKELLGTYEGKLLMFDESIGKLTPEKRIEIAKEAEDAGLKFDKRITNGRGTSWNNSESQITLANSDGFVGQYQTTGASLSVNLLAEENGVKQTGGWYTFSRFYNKLDAPKAVGEEAARREVSKLGGKKVKSQVVPVVVSREVASDFAGRIFGAAPGGSIYRRSSYLVDKIGQEIGSPLVSIIDDATMPDGIASRPFDAEGVKTSQITIIENGVLKNYICESYSARRLKLKPTGNASHSYQSTPNVRSTNLYLKTARPTRKRLSSPSKTVFI